MIQRSRKALNQAGLMIGNSPMRDWPQPVEEAQNYNNVLAMCVHICYFGEIGDITMTSKRTDRIDLRVHPDAKEALQAAAALRHKSVSEFILDSALGAADEILADRRYFGLNAEQWQAFQAALDTPPKSLPRIKRLMQEPGIFD